MTAEEWTQLRVGEAVRNTGVSFRVIDKKNGVTKLRTVRQVPKWDYWREDDNDHKLWHRWPQDDQGV